MRCFLYSITIFFGLLILPIAHAETKQELAPTTSDVQIQHKNKSMQRYLTIIADIDFLPSISEKLPDYEKILTEITAHKQKPSDDELEKLNVLYDALKQNDVAHALPRLTRYYLDIYRKEQKIHPKEQNNLPENWQKMSNRSWLNFVNERATPQEIQEMIEQGLDPNKMITLVASYTKEQYSLLYATIENKNAIELIKVLLDAGADANLANAEGRNFPFDRAVELKKFDVAMLLIQHGAINIGDNYYTTFDNVFQKIVHHHYGLDYNIDLSNAILTLETLIAQGANPNTTISYENGDTDHTKTPLSYALLACINDDEANHTDDRNFYLDIMKLLVNEKTDWNAKDSISSYYGGGETSTIADTLEWIGEEKDKPKCIEAADYVKNHLKENNITITE